MNTGIARWRVVDVPAAKFFAYHRVIAATLIIFLATPALPQASKGLEIPFENSRVFSLILVRAEVNGKPAVLVVDTASNHTIISSELLAVRLRDLDSRVSSIKGSGWTGTGGYAKATLKVGPVIWSDHRIIAMEMRDLSKSLGQRVDGLLGTDFLGEFKRVTFDSKNHKIILEP
jgi:hypothetical protein